MADFVPVDYQPDFGDQTFSPQQQPDPSYNPTRVTVTPESAWQGQGGNQITPQAPQQPAANLAPSPLDQSRDQFVDELDNPAVYQRFQRLIETEVGGQGPQATQAFVESVMNRAAARGQTLWQAMNDAGYYPRISLVGRTPTDPDQYGRAIEAGLRGSNVSSYATGNASGTVGFAGGPQTYAPGTGERFGIEGPDRKWAEAILRGQPLDITPRKERVPGWQNNDTDNLGNEQDQLLNQHEGPAQVPPTPAETLQYLARGIAPAATGLASGEPNPNWSLPVPEYGKVPQTSTDPRWGQALIEMAGMLEPPAKISGLAVAAAPMVARLAPDMAAGVANAMKKAISVEYDPHVWTGATPINMVNATPEDYQSAHAAFKGASKHPHMVDDLPADPSQTKFFLSPDGKIGFGVSQGNAPGDIKYVFKHPESPQPGAVKSILSTAVQQGGNRLDAYDTILPSMYGESGFRAVARIPFDPAQAPAGWDYAKYAKYNNGRPDIVFMVHDPYHKAGYNKLDGVRVGSWDEAAAIQQAEAARIDARKAAGAERFRQLADNVNGLKDMGRYLTPEEQELTTSRNADVLTRVFSELPFSSEEMAAVAYSGRAKRGWYENSANALVDIFGAADAPRFTALLAAMSPRTSVESNAINALNTWTNWVRAGRPTDPKAIIDILGQSVQGKLGAGSVLDAWKGNSIRALSSKDPSSLELSGPKVNSFLPNLRKAVNEVTNDAWMANYGNIDQGLFQRAGRVNKIDPEISKSFGVKSPGYIAMNAAVRRAADIISQKTGQVWTPAEVQETVWSWAKTLAEKANKDQSVEDLLKGGNISHEEIANTPDFALLFAQEKYRKILELGGYGKQVQEAADAAARRSAKSGANAVTGTPVSSEGSGFAESTYRRHLFSAARRLDERRASGLNVESE